MDVVSILERIMIEFIWSTLYMSNLLDDVEREFPEFIKLVYERTNNISEHDHILRRFDELLRVIGINNNDYKNHQQILTHIRRNEHKHTWWLL